MPLSRVQNASVLQSDAQLAFLNRGHIVALSSTAFVLGSNTLSTGLLFAMMQTLIVVLSQELAGLGVVGGFGGIAVQELLPF